MKRMVIVAGFFALLATAIVVATYNLQPAKACVPGQPYGACVSDSAQAGGFGTKVSTLTHAVGGLGHDCRSAGDKGCGPGLGAGGSSVDHGKNG